MVKFYATGSELFDGDQTVFRKMRRYYRDFNVKLF